MHEPITINYVPDGDDWRITAVAGAVTNTGKATGLIAARDQADQLVTKMTPGQENPTVVHLLNGDAVAFTTLYLHARLGLEIPGAESAPVAGPGPVAEPAAQPTADAPTAAQPEPVVPTQAVAHRVEDDRAEDKPVANDQADAEPVKIDQADRADKADRAETRPAHAPAEPAVSTAHLLAADSVETVIEKPGEAAAGPSDDGEANQLTQVINAVQ